MKYICSFILTLVFLLLMEVVCAQQTDTTAVINMNFITDQIENIAATTDLEIDYSDLLNEFLYYSKNPIAINSAQRIKLVDLMLVNEMQLSNLEIYLSEYGYLQSKFELALISGFDKESVERLLPFITFSMKTKVVEKPKFKNVFKYGRHQIITRYSQILESSKAYSFPNDSAIEHPGSIYLGSPQKYYARYSFNFHKQVRIGFTWEKDAGELISKNKLSDTLLSLLDEKFYVLNDFASLHIYVADLGFVKKAVVGDYHLEFGQGLTLWSGLSFGKSAESTLIKKYGRGITPNTSVNENRFMRGAAITMRLGSFELTSFYSNNNIDGNLIIVDSLKNQGISGLLETGNHRTINELLDKNILNIQSFGANLNYKSKQFSAGITALQTTVDISFLQASEIYKKFYFTGNKLSNFGLDFNYNFDKIKLFGEISSSDNSALAGIFGANLFLNDRFLMTLSYRKFSKYYFNFFNNPFREGSVGRNETGYYFGIKVLLASKLSFDSYVDYFSFPWIKYGVSSPSKGVEYLIQLNYSPLKNVNMYFRVKLDNKQENFRSDYDFTSQLESAEKKSFRFNISYSVFDFLLFKNRIETVIYSKNEDSEKGYLFYQDVLYRPENFPLSLSFRYALFSTDGWDSRIYAYENDVLYAFSVPAYYEKGQRIYLMFKIDALKNLDLWLRISRTIFRDKTSIGSGADEINSNHKTEVKIQAKIRL